MERFARLPFGVVPTTFCFQIRRSTSCAQRGQTHKEDHELAFITKPESTHTAFRVDTAETLRALYDRARGQGVAVPYALDNGIARSFFAPDPEGNAIEVYLATREPLRETPPLADPEAIDRLVRAPTA